MKYHFCSLYNKTALFLEEMSSDHQIAPSKVNIPQKRMVKAVFGWPAIHTKEDLEKKNNPH